MKWTLCTFILLLISGCTPKFHTAMSRAEMVTTLESTFDLGMSEHEVVQGLDDLGLHAEYGTSWYNSQRPDIAALVRKKHKRIFELYPYGYGMLAITLNPQSSELERIEYVTLMPPIKPREWWPKDPVVMIGATP